METIKIEVGSAVAAVVVEGDTLRPKTHVDGMLLGVGYSPDSAAEHELQKVARSEIWNAATEVTGGEPEGGWRWLDHNGHEVFPG